MDKKESDLVGVMVISSLRVRDFVAREGEGDVDTVLVVVSERLRVVERDLVTEPETLKDLERVTVFETERDPEGLMVPEREMVREIVFVSV